jgi:hypothetical protein
MRTNSAWVPSILLPRIHPPFVAMGIHEFSAIDAFAACGDAGDQHPVSRFEHRDGRPDLLDDANALVAENPAGLKVATSPLRM